MHAMFRKEDAGKRTVKITIALVLGAFIYYISRIVFSYQHSLLLGVLIAIVVLWSNEGLPLGVVSVLPLFLLPGLGITKFNETLPNYFNPILLLFIGGMLLALSVEKVNLHRFLSSKIISVFPKTSRGAIFSIAVSAALLSSILSNTTITLIMLPVALVLTTDKKLKIRLLLALAYGASIGGILTPIGTPPNLIFLGFAQGIGIAEPGFFKWIVLMLPLAILMLLAIPYLLSLGIKNEKFRETKAKKLDKEQKKLSFVLLALILILILNSPIKPFYSGLGLNENLVLFGFGLLMFFPGFRFLKFEDVKRVPISIILLLGAGFTIAFAVLNTGLVDEIAPYLSGISSLPLMFIIIALSSIVVFSSEIMSNTAQVSVILPVFYQLAQNIGLDPKFILLLGTISASLAFMLPVGTPPNAIVFASRSIKIKDMIKFGFFANLISIILTSLVAFFYWRLFL